MPALKHVSPEELTLEVGGVALAAKRWRNGTRRVLALHGWLDNAASFDHLAPLLDADVVALDLSGHGLSYHRTLQGTYNIWDDLPDLLRAADALGWPAFNLIGHSRGAIISALLAAAMPERIESVVMLDGVHPLTRPSEDFFDQLALHLREHLEPAGSATVYPSFEHALRARCIVSGIGESAARPIVERGLQQTEQGWIWRSDRRLRLASTMRLSEQHIDIMLQKLTPQRHLLLLATANKDGMAKRSAQLAQDRQLRWESFPGGHHFQLEPQVASLAKIINAFWGESEDGASTAAPE